MDITSGLVGARGRVEILNTGRDDQGVESGPGPSLV
jgi:hypothetical protein